MKNLRRGLIASMLALFARAIVRKYAPTVIMVTGSVGKTSTKDAITAALAAGSYVRGSEKSFNSEFGVPFTIIGVENPWSNTIAWMRVFLEAFALILLPNHYPKVLVLEVGADRPGDLARILRIAHPDAVVVTRLPEVPVHVEAYASAEAVREEEFAPAYALAAGAPLIINATDAHARHYAARVPARLTTYGIGEGDIAVHDVGADIADGRVVGMKGTVALGGETRVLNVPGALGRQQLLPHAAALALSGALGRSLAETFSGLAHYTPPPGRTRLLPGIEGSLLVDDSYNSSPAAVEEALAALALIPAKRRIAILGDMLELGRHSISEHERIGGLAKKYVDMLITVGIRSHAIADGALSAGMKERVIHRTDSAAMAANLAPSLIKPGDVVLIKGSQSIRTERITAALLKNPEDTRLLVRQEKEWKKR